MRTIETWFDEYERQHRHPVNRAIHAVCVPAITWSTLAVLDAVRIHAHSAASLISGATLAVAVAGAFAVRWSRPLGAALVLVTAAMIAANRAVEVRLDTPLWIPGLAVLVVAWGAQFAGHALEGSRPAFTRDVAFLLVSPLWLLAGLFGSRSARRN
jgi:uncharacterized membrane protein YGL010W